MNDRPRFGLIGTGVWPRLVQAPAAAQSDAVSFTSVFGRNALKAEALAAPFRVRAYSDLGAFLDSVDIVGITLPPAVQPHFALAAARAGKAAILEKPLALDPLEADAIAREFETRELPALVFFTHLLIPRTQAWLNDVATAGGWIAARVDSYSRLLHDEANPFFGTVAAWRGAAGALWDSGPHSVAMLLTTLGDIVQVSAIRGTGDLKLLTLTHVGGAVSSIALTMDAPTSLPGETALFGAAGKTTLPQSPDWFADSTVAYAGALRLVAGALAEKKVDIAPGVRLGAKVTKVLAAAEQSIATGRRIDLP
ncbi:MAG TPA: Gfo/Idh/MocA family oxidoreductase [Devosia sp.]|nr:Gfo/Idh/MocA family oxidoreductase [Devosia sp.]